MTDTDLVDRLAEHRTLGAVPREELEWLAAHGSLRQVQTGEALSSRGVPVEGRVRSARGRTGWWGSAGAEP